MKLQYKIERKGGLLACLLALIVLNSNCKKLVQVAAPVTNVNEANVYTNNTTAAAVLTGLYTKMSSDDGNILSGGFASISVYAGLSGDELTLYSGITNQGLLSYYQNALSNQSSPSFWSNIYPVVYTTNAAIEGLSGSNSLLIPAVQQQLLGEAKFMRAFCYFYLANLFGDVPLVLTTDYETNASLARASKSTIFQQIIKDLNDAESLLSNQYLQADALTAYPANGEQRIRPTKWAAMALLARAYLYTDSWDSAEAVATSVINDNSEYYLTGLDSVFLKNSKEAIWQLQPVTNGSEFNTGDGFLFVLPATGPNTSNYPLFLSSNVLNGFEAGDKRRMHWIDSVKPSSSVITYYYPYKYKIGAGNTPVQEYPMVFRLGEQYLIRAEARAEQNNISGAQADLNIIRTRAGLPNTAANNQSALLAAILHERQVELFTEWGNRWLDLKRTGSVDSVMARVCSNEKGTTWDTRWQLYPIPMTDLQYDNNLVQNSGY